MSISFSEATNNTGIVQQVRDMLRVDSTQYPTSRIVNSVNNYHDTVTGFAIGADRRFQWDDTNHSKLPIGTTNLVANQSDYSFLTDEQGNSILNLTRIDILDASGIYRQLAVIDQAQIDMALDQYNIPAGLPLEYDKIADNIIRLYPKPAVSVTDGIKFYFQRTGSYFTASDTTKSPGVAPILHRGYVINAVYDALLAGIGSASLQAISIEKQIEEKKMEKYFGNRNTDEKLVMTAIPVNSM
jgi:hypothetical protein